MLSELGSLLIGFSFFGVIFSGFGLFWGIKRGDPRWLKSAQRALYAGGTLLLIAILLLLTAFLLNQFQIEYVALHSNTTLPFYLKISALWAGQEGSLLFWAFLQTLIAAVIARKAKIEDKPLVGWAVLILSVVSALFIALTLIFSNPFLTISPMPSNGQGLNPLLRHPGMIFHPPVLYLGYVGLAIPFAFALSALIVGEVDAWPKETRRWLLISWFALGLGIILGARWAYDVLGWGGYWGWDAVENAGLMPWLTATALLHGLDRQTRRKGFKVWNITLAVLSFILVIFGTFTTRSGLIQSVHAFSRSEIGPYLLAVIILVLVGSLVLMIVQRKKLGEIIYPEKIFSRDGATFFTLLLLMLITLSILAGTLLPTITQGRFSAPVEWFNKVVGPQFLALVFLMGVCPVLGRLGNSTQSAFRRLLPGIIGAVMLGMAAILLGYVKPLAFISLIMAGFAGGVAFWDIVKVFILHNKKKKTNEHPRVSGRKGIGGELVHLGIALVTVGVVGTMMYASVNNVTMMPGESLHVGEYELLYEDLFQDAQDDHLTTWITLPVYKDSKYLATLSPKIIYYSTYQQSYAEPAIRTSLLEDLYLVFFQWDSSGQISLSVDVNPLSVFLWVGGGVLLIGGLLAWWPTSEDFEQDAQGKSLTWKRIGGFLLLLVIVILIISVWRVQLPINKTVGRPLPGQTAPGFSSVDYKGVPFTMSDYDGDILVLHFWATWCSQCVEEMAAFESVWRVYQNQDVQFVGVAMDDSLADVGGLANKLNISFPLIVDENDVVTSLYGITAVPETYVIDMQGNVAFLHIGSVGEDVLFDEIVELLGEED